jgi:hypothetical protein
VLFNTSDDPSSFLPSGVHSLLSYDILSSPKVCSIQYVLLWSLVGQAPTHD